MSKGHNLLLFLKQGIQFRQSVSFLKFLFFCVITVTPDYKHEQISVRKK